MAGNGTPVNSVNFDTQSERVFQVALRGSNTGKIVPAVDPLRHMTPDGNVGVGPCVAFGREWVRHVPVSRHLLIVPCAVGGSKLVGGPWAVGGTYYNATVANANAAVAAEPNPRVVGILWMQGEADAQANIPGPTYAAALDATLTGLRADITGAADAPIIVGPMVQTWRETPNGTSLAIHAAHVDTPNRLTRAAFVEGPGHGYVQDVNHWTPVAQRHIGRQMALAAHTIL
jgi:hypothetical protein